MTTKKTVKIYAPISKIAPYVDLHLNREMFTPKPISRKSMFFAMGVAAVLGASTYGFNVYTDKYQNRDYTLTDINACLPIVEKSSLIQGFNIKGTTDAFCENTLARIARHDNPNNISEDLMPAILVDKIEQLRHPIKKPNNKNKP